MAVEVVVHPTPALLAATTAARLITRLVDLQAAGRVPSIVLTGGGAGIATLEQVAASPARDAVDWSRVELFWGDERFVPGADPERNEGQARVALLNALAVDPARVHAMAAADGEFGDDVDAAAAAYGALVDQHLASSPGFDVVMLGMGGEGHVASLFPDSPALSARGSVVAVRDCPKPPPTRISLTLPTVRTAAEVWIITTGAEKAEAVAASVGGASENDFPAAGALGRDRTLWLIDPAAASGLPSRTAALPVRDD